MASDWLAAVLPANQVPGLKVFVYSHGYLLVTQAQGAVKHPHIISAPNVFMR